MAESDESDDDDPTFNADGHWVETSPRQKREHDGDHIEDAISQGKRRRIELSEEMEDREKAIERAEAATTAISQGKRRRIELWEEMEDREKAIERAESATTAEKLGKAVDLHVAEQLDQQVAMEDSMFKLADMMPVRKKNSEREALEAYTAVRSARKIENDMPLARLASFKGKAPEHSLHISDSEADELLFAAKYEIIDDPIIKVTVSECSDLLGLEQCVYRRRPRRCTAAP